MRNNFILLFNINWCRRIYEKNIIISLLLVILSIVFIILNIKSNFIYLNDSNNVELAIYIENEQTNSIPTRESGYYYDLEKSSCNNDLYYMGL